MTASSHTVNEAFEQKAAPATALAPTRPFYWSVRRELFEYRSIYLGPLAIAAVILLGFVFVLVNLPRTMQRAMTMEPMAQRHALAQPFDIAAALIMAAAFIVSIFYSLGSLYGERRDRSILFWKSLPVSDLTTVLAKASVPLLILPSLVIVIVVVVHLIMLLLGLAVVSLSGADAATMWAKLPFFQLEGGLLYSVAAMTLWHAPLY